MPATVSRSATSAQRHVRRDPRVPHPVDHVELACPAVVREARPGPLQLVLGAETGLVHGLLVERHEADSVDPSVHREIERPPEPLQHRGSGRDRDPAARRLGGVDGGHVQKVGNPARVVRVGDGGNLANRRVEPGDLAAGPEHPCVRNDEDVRPLPHVLQVEKAGHQLRPDARGVTLHQCNRRLHGRPAIRPRAGRASRAFLRFHLQPRSGSVMPAAPAVPTPSAVEPTRDRHEDNPYNPYFHERWGNLR